MDYVYTVAPYGYSSELYHHGTKGMKWGDRKYQYEDGTLTPEGYRHYGYGHGGGGVGRSEHTKELKRAGAKAGMKRGAKIGVATGLAVGGLSAWAAKTLGMDNKSAAVIGGAFGLGQLGLSTLSGRIQGGHQGKQQGMRETQAARDYIERNYDKKLKDFLAQDKADYKARKQGQQKEIEHGRDDDESVEDPWTGQRWGVRRTR